MLVKFVILWNAFCSIVVTLAGISTEVITVPTNALSPIVSKLDSDVNVNVASNEAPLNASLPIVKTFVGIVNVVILLHP